MDSGGPREPYFRWARILPTVKGTFGETFWQLTYSTY